MSQLSLHTSRDTTPSGKTGAMWPLELFVGISGVFLVAFSIYLFMVNATSEKVNELLTAQNAAALKLSTNIDYYKYYWTKEKSGAEGQPLPPGLFEDIVEFSRKNATLMKTVPRLTFRGFFSSPSLEHTLKSLSKLAPYVVDRKNKQVPSNFGNYFTHYGVSPRTGPGDIVDEGVYQIELYQLIRDYAQDESSFDKGFFSALTIYFLPVAYALLGAFLYTFRHLRHTDQSPDRISRFLMAGIAGIAVSSFNALLPKDVLLSPLAISFVVGYSIHAFTSRIDQYMHKFSKGSTE
jgi:hypothetical protein